MAYYGEGRHPTRGADIRRRYVSTLAESLGGSWSMRQGIRWCWSPVTGSMSTSRATCVQLSSAQYPGIPVDAVSIRDLRRFTELTEEMAHAEVVIASRFHNLICALRLARPTVSVGYAVKNRNSWSALGVDGFCQDIMQLDSKTRLLGAGPQRLERMRVTLAGRIRQGHV